jgi:hypothetical protein
MSLMMLRWTLLLLSAWILFAAPATPSPGASPVIACRQTQQVEYASPVAPSPAESAPFRWSPRPAPAETSDRSHFFTAKTDIRPIESTGETGTSPSCKSSLHHLAGRHHAVAAPTGVPEPARDAAPNPATRPYRNRARYSTVTDLARFRGWSTSHPRRTAM